MNILFKNSFGCLKTVKLIVSPQTVSYWNPCKCMQASKRPVPNKIISLKNGFLCSLSQSLAQSLHIANPIDSIKVTSHRPESKSKHAVIIPDHMAKPCSRWTPELSCKIIEVARSKAKKTWKMIAAECFPGFTGQQVANRYHEMKQFSLKGRWSKEEVALLKRTVLKFGTDWMSISKIVGTRNSDQCFNKWAHLYDPSVGRVPWTDDENNKLVQLVLSCSEFKTEEMIPDYSNVNWKQLPKSFPGKSAIQCRHHFIRHLTDLARERLHIVPHDKSHWGSQETEKLVSFVKQHPGKWTLISCKMQTRSPYQCQKRCYFLKHRKQMSNLF